MPAASHRQTVSLLPIVDPKVPLQLCLCISAIWARVRVATPRAHSCAKYYAGGGWLLRGKLCQPVMAKVADIQQNIDLLTKQLALYIWHWCGIIALEFWRKHERRTAVVLTTRA